MEIPMAKQPKIKTPNFVRDNPLAAATISKLTKSSMSGMNGKSIEQLTMELPQIAMSVKDKIKNNDSILELFPDIELAIQIIVSSIISPNDMMNTNSVYYGPNINLPPDVVSTLTETIKKHINLNYNLDGELYNLVKETMFTKGATAYAIIPEASLDDIINPDYNGQISMESLENFYSKTNILGKSSSISCSVEDLKNVETPTMKIGILSAESELTPKQKVIEVTEDSLGIQIIDNPSILKVGDRTISNIKNKIEGKIPGYMGSLSSEDFENEEDLAALDALFKNVDRLPLSTVKEVKTIDTASRNSIGMPMTFKLPIESVIPVYALNDVTKHIGYFILLDDNGLPLDIVDDLSSPTNSQSMIQTSGQIQDAKTSMIEKARAALYGITKNDATIDNIEEIYGDLVERMIKNKLKSGDYAGIADIKSNADIYRVMLFRTLRAQSTKLLFLPAELVAYYAFEYRENGTGKSLLEKNAILFSIRGILLFATLMASVKNSITTTEVSATIDEQITDPEKIMQLIVSEVMKTREQQLPVGVTKIDDLVDWVHREGFKFKFDHPGLPKIDIDTNDVGTSKIIPDDTLDQNIRDRQYMSFGLTPEILQSGYSDSFATTVVAKNLLFAKRMLSKQRELNIMRTNHVRKIIKSDMSLQEKMLEIIDANMANIMKFAKNKQLSDAEDAASVNDVKKSEVANYIISIYANEIVVELPEPQQTEANHIKEAFETYKDMISSYFDEVLSSSALPQDLVGALSDKIEIIKNIYKATFLRKWMNDNGFMTEVSEAFTMREDGKPIYDALGDFEAYYKTLVDNALVFFKKHGKEIEKNDKKLEKLGESTGGGMSSDGGNEDTENTDEENNNTDENAEGGNEEGGEDTGNEEDTDGLTDMLNEVDNAGGDEKEEKPDEKEEKKEENKEEDKKEEKDEEKK